MKRNIRLERFYAFPPERVFRALTDPTAMADWLMKNDFQPRLGHKFQFRSKPQGNWNGITDCEVIEFEPPRRIAYTWTGQNKNGGMALANTTVRWTLQPEKDGTRLLLEHTGFNGFGEVAVSFMLSMGWKKMLKTRLPAAIEQVRTDSYVHTAGTVPECRDDAASPRSGLQT